MSYPNALTTPIPRAERYRTAESRFRLEVGARRGSPSRRPGAAPPRRHVLAAMLGLLGGRVAIVLCSALLSSIFVVPARAQIAVGDTFPDLASAGLTDGTVPDTAGRVVLVDFWASWCAPCKASFPAFSRLHAALAPRGLVIVAVSVDEKPAAYAAFVKKWQPPFATVLDQSQTLVRAVQVPAMPTSYLIGRDGRVRSVHQGFHGAATERELRETIEKLLADAG